MFFSRCIQRTSAALAAAVPLVMYVAMAAAQRTKEPPPPPDKGSWVLSYALVILAVALGLMAVCRPGSRTKDIKIAEE